MFLVTPWETSGVQMPGSLHGSPRDCLKIEMLPEG